MKIKLGCENYLLSGYGTRAAPTDLAVLLGCYMTALNDRCHHATDGGLSCCYWVDNSVDYQKAQYIDDLGLRNCMESCERKVAVRPSLCPEEASKISPNKEMIIRGFHKIVEYGEYPQTIVDWRTSTMLETLYGLETLHKTGKDYTFDSVDPKDCDKPFKDMSHPEYEMGGKKYIRVLGRTVTDDEHDDHRLLSDSKRVKEGKPYWIEVQPIKWLVLADGTMITQKCILSGIQFDTKNSGECSYNNGEPFIKQYLNTYFANEIEPSQFTSMEEYTDQDDKIAKISAYKKGLLKGIARERVSKVKGKVKRKACKLDKWLIRKGMLDFLTK